MAPTLNDGESALVIRDMERLERGDVVAFRYPRDESTSFVKRVIGLPGDAISSEKGVISINGEPLDRSNSSDSRMWGNGRRPAIWGRVVLR